MQIQTKSLVEQMKEAEILNKTMNWGLPDKFFQFDISKLDLSEFKDKTKVLSFNLPELNKQNSSQRTHAALMTCIKQKAKILKISFSISKDLVSQYERVDLIDVDCKSNFEVVTFDSTENYDSHNGIVIDSLLDQSKTGDRFLSVQGLWALMYFLDFFKKMDNHKVFRMALAGYSFYSKFNEKPRALVIIGSNKGIIIDTVETDRHIFSSVPKITSYSSLLDL